MLYVIIYICLKDRYFCCFGRSDILIYSELGELYLPNYIQSVLPPRREKYLFNSKISLKEDLGQTKEYSETFHKGCVLNKCISRFYRNKNETIWPFVLQDGVLIFNLSLHFPISSKISLDYPNPLWGRKTRVSVGKIC